MKRAEVLEKASQKTGVKVLRGNLEHAIKRGYVDRPKRTRTGSFFYEAKHLRQLVGYIKNHSFVGAADAEGTAS
ncbi:hypothetical protein [Crateriforma spongiae]|uniref:hypothetical protein n=1 Tax=Crateriforma spongiae TaxID=2724528 RepID=UPI0014485ECD|nr:hypothetical protein [Crateriforma spongiae]